MKRILAGILVLLIASIQLPMVARAIGEQNKSVIGSNIDYLEAGKDYVDHELLVQVSSEAEAAFVARAYGAKVKSYSKYGFAVLSLTKGTVGSALVHSVVNQAGHAVKASLNMIYTIPKSQVQATASDPDIGEQWFHDDMGDSYAWNVTKGSPNVLVAVIDTGIDVDHPEFIGKISSLSYNARTGVQVSAGDLSAVQDDYSHGSHVAGIIAASADNGSGGCGVAPNVKLMVIKANGAPPYTNSFDTATLIAAIRYAADNGADIINMSLSRVFDTGENVLEHAAIQYAQAKGALVVCAAGNSRDNHAGYPAAYDECVAVSALQSGLAFDYSYSNYGPEIDLAAPGTNIYSCIDGGTYTYFSGTSMAAPMVSGAAALVLSRFPALTVEQLKAKLYNSSVDRYTAGIDAYFGHGAVNTINALSTTLYTVAFDSKGGSPVPSVLAAPNTAIVQPSRPTKTGYHLEGWYLDSNCTVSWDFGPVTGNMKVYARWTPGEYGYTVVNSKVHIYGYFGPDTDLTIPNTIDGIPVVALDGGFSGNGKIVSVHLPDSLLSIGMSVFMGCSNLQSVSFGRNLQTIGSMAFAGCVELENVVLPGSLVAVGDFVFKGCCSLATADVPGGIVNMGIGLFESCNGLSSVTLRKGFSDVANDMFFNCSALSAISLPSTVTRIGTYSFGGCAALTNMVIPDSVKTIGSFAFSITAANYTMYLKSVTIGNGVTEIGSFAFQGNSSLATITMGSSVKTIEEYAFSFCGFSEIRFSDKLLSLGKRAFQACSSLNSVYFHGNAPAVGTELFFNCSDISVYYINGKTGFSSAWNGFPTVTFLPSAPPPVRFSLNDATGTAPASQSVAYGGKLTRPADPTRTGYVFGGWCLNPTGQGDLWDFDKNTVTWGGTLYAKWTVVKYAIVAVPNSTLYGSVTGSGSFTSGALVTLKAIPKAGYRFVRWLEGSTAVSTSAEYKFNVTKARALKAEFVKIATPTVKAASASYSSVLLTWAVVAGANGYEVSRYDLLTQQYKVLSTVTATGFTNTGLVTGTAYTYKVRVKCVAGDTITYGSYSTSVSTKPVPAAPVNVKAASDSYNSIKVSWSTVAGATKYKIYRATTQAGTYSLLTETSALVYTNIGVNTGTTYYYKVKAYRLVCSTQVYGDPSAIVSAKTSLAVPTSVKAARASSTSIKVSWGVVVGATQNEVWRCTTAYTGTYSLLMTTANAYYTNMSLTTGKTYWYKVRAYRLVGSTKVYSGYSSVVYAKP